MRDMRLDSDGWIASRRAPTFRCPAETPKTQFIAHVSSSLGASPLSFTRNVTYSLMLSALATTTFDSRLAASLVPAELEFPVQSAVAPLVRISIAFASPAAERSLAGIRRIMDEVSVEGGVTHPAQSRLDSHLAAFGEAGLEEAVKSSGPARAADLLRVLGRTEGLSESLRTALVVWGLASRSVDVRDAAVQAVESWGDVKLTAHLEKHVERVDWLRTYASQVVRDLRS